MFAALVPFAMLLSRRGETSGGGCAPVGCFVVLLGIGLVLYMVFRGRNNRRRIEGAAARPMGTGPIQPQTFACPFPKCPNCGASTDKQKQQWDGLRSVTWNCGYCGHTQVQALKDEELPASARQRLGLEGAQGYGPRRDFDGNGNGFGGGGMGSGLGGVMTGMMLGSMLGGSHNRGGNQDGWGGGSESGGGSGDNWDSGGDAGGGWDSGGDSGGDWGGDSGGDSGGDW